MSYKIHKALGYGLTGLITEDNKLADPFINLDAPGIKWSEEDENGKWSYAAWQEYLLANPNPDSGMLRVLANFNRRQGKDDSNLLRHVVYNSEGGDPGTILIIPPGLYEQNYRFNSIIDRHESVVRQGESMKPLIDVLPSGISPWNGWTRTDTMETLEGDAKFIMDWIYLEANEDEKRGGYKALTKLLDYPYSPETMASIIKPEIPVAVKAFADWIGLFNDEKAWKYLRPMIYTYWS